VWYILELKGGNQFRIIFRQKEGEMVDYAIEGETRDVGFNQALDLVMDLTRCQYGKEI